MQRVAIRPEAMLGFFCLMPFAIAAMLLAVFVGGDTANIFTLITFFFILIFSLVFAKWAEKYNKDGIKWLDAPEWRDWKWLLVGFGGMLLAGFIIPMFIPDVLGILIGLGLGGVALGIALYKSETIIVPWLSHAAYNIVAVVLASASVIPLTKSIFYVPSFSFSGLDPSNVLAQAALQLMAVAPAEEGFKVSFAVGVFILAGRHKALAIACSIIAWVFLHTILAYPLRL